MDLTCLTMDTCTAIQYVHVVLTIVFLMVVKQTL